MKKNVLMGLAGIFGVAGVLFLASCQSVPNADDAKTKEEQQVAAAAGQSYKVDTLASKLEWVGTKQNGQHNGEFEITEGSLKVDDGQLTGGSFDIDMTSLVVNDLEGKDKQKLEGHLKSPDFFETNEFPTARFEITNVKPIGETNANTELDGATHLISGNLTLKNSTKNVTFPARVSMDDQYLSAVADFNIDRTEWGLNYKGPNNPQDWFIKKEVNLKVNLKAGLKDKLQANNSIQ